MHIRLAWLYSGGGARPGRASRPAAQPASVCHTVPQGLFEAALLFPQQELGGLFIQLELFRQNRNVRLVDGDRRQLLIPADRTVGSRPPSGGSSGRAAHASAGGGWRREEGRGRREEGGGKREKPCFWVPDLSEVKNLHFSMKVPGRFQEAPGRYRGLRDVWRAVSGLKLRCRAI